MKIDKGLDIPIAGVPEQVIETGRSLKTVALLGTDYIGLKPRMLVEPGQVVSLGEPLVLDKSNSAVQFTSPGTGRVVAVNRGRRRVLQSVVIELDESAASEKTFDPVQSQNQAAIRDLLLQSGAWTGFRTRPYNRVPDSSSRACSIFITAIDTRPLAANPGVVVADRENEFTRGTQIVAQLTDGPVFLCTGPDWSGPEPSGNGIQRIEFDGPHPAGLPGTHIHYLNPVGAQRTVWHIDYQDVIAIGHLFKTGRLLTERVVSIGGPGAVKPRLIRTRLGASISELMVDEVVSGANCQLISGSVIDGFVAEGPMAFLGRYDNQISVVVKRAERRWFGWFGTEPEKFSFAGLTESARGQKHLREFTTAQNGRRVAMIPAGVFERVMPLDILPVPLLRSLLVKDTDSAQALGCLELAEDDLALSSFVCPAKQDYAAALRINLDQIEKEG
ncbi:MAG: Na(+)-translocating NADH-quinone reductase subunit A [Gammaproteobacteria bacterium]|nr:Na(+)-translocating NADH-quinone reductase subunit A [Gammaproteobacteria bacterium]